ncbi:helix-turn-helix domain-containing protein [Leptospira sp. WS60.C2]
MPLAKVREEVINAIKKEVKRRGLSIRMIVDISDLSYAQIQKILADDHPNVTLDSLLYLCEALKIPYGLYIQDKKS